MCTPAQLPPHSSITPDVNCGSNVVYKVESFPSALASLSFASLLALVSLSPFPPKEGWSGRERGEGERAGSEGQGEGRERREGGKEGGRGRGGGIQ